MDSDVKVTTDEMLRRISEGWDAFNAYLDTLTEQQATGPTDAAGWSVKDHVAHIGDWEVGILALLKGENRPAAMGVDEATWHSRDYDVMNALLREKHLGKSWAEVRALTRDIHDRLVSRVAALSDEDLMRPYAYYQPGTTAETPVFAYLVGNTFEHYAEHRPWIEAIVAGGENT